MYQSNHVVCPVCNDDHLLLKYEATYEYSYIIDSNAPGINNTKDLLPYMYDKREQKCTKQYIECSTCGTNYPCYFDMWTENVSVKSIQEAIASAYNSRTK